MPKKGKRPRTPSILRKRKRIRVTVSVHSIGSDPESSYRGPTPNRTPNRRPSRRFHLDSGGILAGFTTLSAHPTAGSRVIALSRGSVCRSKTRLSDAVA